MGRGPLVGAVAIGMALSASAQAQIPQSQRDALIALYNSTGGANWTNSTGWNGAPGTECSWFGIACDANGANVTDIDLNSNNLSGMLPPLGALQALQTVNFRFDKLTGDIPGFTGLSALRIFDYGDNLFTGKMPSLQGLTALQEFSVEGNQLTGNLPVLDNLANLVYVNVQGNVFSGPIPPFVGVPALQQFSAANNQLTGGIPDLSALHALVDFDVAYNQLDGTIPSLDGLSNLVKFQTTINKLHGPFPSMHGLTALQTFSVSGNRLTGSMPQSLAESPQLEEFDAYENQLEGSLPLLAGLSKLTNFEVESNRLSGGIPPLDGMPALKVFRVYDNALQGHLPTLTGHPALRIFEVYTNQLDGPIPALDGLNQLVDFGVFENHFDGKLPLLTGLSSLTRFNASSNQLSDVIPPLTGLTNLTDFEVQSNRLTGSLPSLAGLNALQYFRAYDNQLSGKLPTLAGLTALIEFDVGANHLSDTIPPLTGLTALRKFDVSGNQLTGTLPSLAGLSALYAFRVGDNKLSGVIPAVPSPNGLANYNSSLCPNALAPSTDTAWDAATGDTPWYDTCAVNQSNNGAPTTQDSTQIVLSQDGKIRVFQSLQTNLTADSGNAGGQDVYSTTADGDPVLESIDSSGHKLVGVASLPAVSPDGNVIAFLFQPGAKSYAKDFVAGQMWAGGRGQPKHQVDIGMGGIPADGTSASTPSIGTLNGTNQLAFCSAATNLVPNDANGGRDIFLADPLNANTPIERISVDGNGAELPGDSCEPRLSGDGSKLVFSLSAAPLFGVTSRQIVYKDLSASSAGKRVFTGQFLPITTNTSGQGAGADSSEPTLSSDGSVIAFTSAADLDGLGAPVGGREVYFALKLANGRLIKRARGGDGTVPDGASQHPQISADGSAVVMQTAAHNLLLPKSLGKAGAAIAPPQCGAVAITTNFLSVHALGGPLCSSDGKTTNQSPSISGDGMTTGFDSNAPQANGNTNRNAYAQGVGTYNGLINATKLPNLSGDYSGQWFDPSQNGQGIVVDVYAPDADNNRIVSLTWFVFVDGHPTWVQGAGIARAGSGEDADEVIVQMDQVAVYQGQGFPRGASASVALWGSITLTFSDANTGSMSWRSTYPGYSSGQMSLVHFLGVGLPAQDAANAQVRSCFSGNWFNPAQSGHGFELEVLPGTPTSFLAADWFAFAPDGTPVWLQGAGAISGNSAQLELQLIDGSGAQFPPDYSPSHTTAHDWGSATFTFTDATHATVNWNSTIAGYGSGTQPLQPLGGLDRRGCQ